MGTRLTPRIPIHPGTQRLKALRAEYLNLPSTLRSHHLPSTHTKIFKIAYNMFWRLVYYIQAALRLLDDARKGLGRGNSTGTNIGVVPSQHPNGELTTTRTTFRSALESAGGIVRDKPEWHPYHTKRQLSPCAITGGRRGPV
jgi:hypothetical protein